MSKSVGAFIFWLVAVGAQAAPLPGFVLAAQTPRVSFFTRGEKVDTQRVEKRVTELESLFGQPLAQRATYYRYSTAQEIAAGTGHYAAGVTFAAAGEVHSTEAFHDHELVHLVAGQLGDPGAFFQEGLAVAVGNGGKWQGRSADRIAKGSTVSVPAMISSFDRFDANVAYPVAGSFVGYLIRTEGMTKMTAFFRACGPKVDARAAFTQSFGRTLETAAAEWQRSL